MLTRKSTGTIGEEKKTCDEKKISEGNEETYMDSREGEDHLWGNKETLLDNKGEEDRL